MKSSANQILTLAELEAFDPHAPPAGVERRFWCPLCGENKPRDAAHRCLCANTQTGLWNCKRCGEKGLLGEFRCSDTSDNRSTRQQRAANALKRSFSIKNVSETVLDKNTPSKPVENETSPAIEPWRQIYESAQPVQGTMGEAYLIRRAVPLPIAERAAVLFTKNWHGRPTLVFPVREPGGAVVAIAGRALKSGGIDKPAAGPKKQGGLSLRQRASSRPWTKLFRGFCSARHPSMLSLSRPPVFPHWPSVARRLRPGWPSLVLIAGSPLPLIAMMPERTLPYGSVTCSPASGRPASA